MQRLLLSLPYGMSIRNFLGSSVVSRLQRSFQVSIATPLSHDPAFQQEFAREGLDLCDLPKSRRLWSLGFRYLLDLAEGCHFSRRTNLRTLIILGQCLRRDYPLTYWGRSVVGNLLSRSPRFFSWLRRSQWAFMRMTYYPQLCARLRPALIVQTHPLSLDELPLALYAKRAGIPIAAMLHSWDNLTAKSGIRGVTTHRPGRMLPIQYDRVLVWNDVQRNELLRYYQYAPEQVTVTGAPQFDFYVTHRFADRAAFFREHGLDPQKKLIVFAAASPNLLPKQPEVIDLLIDSVVVGRFGVPVQLLIRTHPRTTMDYLRTKASVAGVTIQYPGAGYVADRVTRGWQNGRDEQREFAETIHHADVVVNVASTVCLDCAALDRPTVCIAFDGYENNPYHRSVLKHYDFDHFRPVMESGGVRIARSRDELVQAVRAYLDNPQLDSEGRARLRAVGCYRVDGGAAERVAEALTTFAYGTQGACTVGA